jgi:hypothetical protein
MPPPPPAPASSPAVSAPTDGMAIAALILGIVAFPGLGCYGLGGIVFGVIALILGRMSLRKIKAANGAIGGRGLAQAGWILGLVATILGVLILAVFAVFLVIGISGALINSPSVSPSQ